MDSVDLRPPIHPPPHPINIVSGNVCRKLISRPFTLNIFNEVEQQQNRFYMQYINLGFVS